MKTFYNILDWLDTHHDAVILLVFFSVLAIALWTNTFGPVGPSSSHPVTTDSNPTPSFEAL